MAISKQKKVQLHDAYIDQLKAAGNVAIFSQSGLSVNESNNLRKLIKREGWLLQVTKKRLFVRAVAETDFDAVKFEDLNGAIWVVYTTPDNLIWPIKTVSTFIKDAKKEKKKFTIDFQGGWMDKKWLDQATMTEVANLPSKEELIGKMMFLLKYPAQSFANVLDQVSKKGE
jgi:large subunit ribosomal protein L10